MTCTASLSAADYYATPTGTGDGSSWATATTLQGVLANDALTDGDVIHLAAGTYTPSTIITGGTTDKEKTFDVTKNISIVGGYAAVPSEGEEANPAANATILSGKLNETDYAYHVMVVRASKVGGKFVSLSGLVLENGQALSEDAPSDEQPIDNGFGGGLYALATNILMDNITIRNNKATGGGGAYLYQSNIEVSNLMVNNNIVNGAGMAGGLWAHTSRIIIKKGNFDTNKTGGNIGGAYFQACPYTYIDNTTFTNNTTGSSGVAGAIQVYGVTKMVIANSTISNNQSGNHASAIYFRAASKAQMVNCTVIGNKGKGAGAITTHDRIKLNIVNSTIVNNSSVEGKLGGIYNYPVTNKNSTINVYNSIVAQNLAGAATTNFGGTPIGRYQTIEETSIYGTDGKTITENAFDPTNLAALANNGGTTETCALTHANAPKVALSEILKLTFESGVPAEYIVRDQRGKTRAFDAIIPGAYDEGEAWGAINDMEHFILYGQSLGVGYQSYPAISHEPLAGNYMIGSQTWINHKNRSLDELTPLYSTLANVDQEHPVYAQTRANGAKCESPLTGMVNHVRKASSDNTNTFIATNCGTSGRTIEQLSKGAYTNLYNDFLTTLNAGKALAQENSTSIKCPALVWMQGEYNYFATKPGMTAESTCTTEKEAYKQLLLDLKNDMQNDVVTTYNQADTPQFIVYQPAGQYIRGKEMAITMAMLEASNKESDIICAGPTYPMCDRGGHYDANGYRWYGEMLGKVYKQEAVGENFIPLQPTKLIRTSTKVLTVEFHVPHTPLAFDELTTEAITNYGFELWEGETALTIESVELGSNGKSVVITTAEDMTGEVLVSYAGATYKGHGNLRDSDPAVGYYNYIDLDTYPMAADETTLRPAFEPKDAEGVIYNKPYPLYNFCVNFYYVLEDGNDEQVLINLTPTSNQEIEQEANINLQKIEEGFYHLSNAGIANVRVISMAGTLILNKRANDNITLNLSELPAASYLVHVTSDKAQECFKINI